MVFTGESYVLDSDPGRCVNLPGAWNDRASSINTNENCVIVFKDSDCHGQSTHLEPGTPFHHHLDGIDFDNSITSAQVCTPPNQICAGITVNVDTSEVPDLNQFGQTCKSTMEQWYPYVCNLLKSPTFLPITSINLRFDPNMDGVAGADAFSRSITGAAKYYRDHQDDVGSMIHEMAHVIQRYSKCAGWVTEGIADWARRMHYEPIKPGKPGPGDNYNSQPVFFLNWINEKYPNSLYSLNAECRQGSYEDDLFVKLTGKNPDQLWADMMREA